MTKEILAELTDILQRIHFGPEWGVAAEQSQLAQLATKSDDLAQRLDVGAIEVVTLAYQVGAAHGIAHVLGAAVDRAGSFEKRAVSVIPAQPATEKPS